MTLTMSIDPGTRNAIAWWVDGRLAGACLARRDTSEASPCLDGVWDVRLLAREISRDHDGFFDTILIEKPVVYQVGQQKGDQQDLIGLAIVVGALTMGLAPYAKEILHVTPQQWGGQVPKKIKNKRAKAALSSEELDYVDLPSAKGLHHNIWDSIGIGQWGNKR